MYEQKYHICLTGYCAHVFTFTTIDMHLVFNHVFENEEILAMYRSFPSLSCTPAQIKLEKQIPQKGNFHQIIYRIKNNISHRCKLVYVKFYHRYVWLSKNISPPLRIYIIIERHSWRNFTKDMNWKGRVMCLLLDPRSANITNSTIAKKLPESLGIFRKITYTCNSSSGLEIGKSISRKCDLVDWIMSTSATRITDFWRKILSSLAHRCTTVAEDYLAWISRKFING